MHELAIPMIELQKEIYDKDYYVDLYEESLNEMMCSAELINSVEYCDKTLVELCNNFWNRLPDSDTIRRDPFWLLCYIAEQFFDE